MLRQYTDNQGMTWRVWDVYPSSREASKKSGRLPTFAEGWLCFESATEKRRLAPIPPDWELCDRERLEQLCARAGHISRTGSQRAQGDESVI